MASSQEMLVHLHRAITFDEYEKELGLNTLADWPSATWKALRADVETLLAQGGELWEWEYRNDFGLTGITGLAVVRGGEIVRKWQLWKA